MNREQSPIQAIFDAVDELDDTIKQSIDRSPKFLYKGQRIILDYVSKSDKLFLDKVFEEIEKNENKENEKIDFDQLKRDAEQEVLEVQKHMAKIQSKKFITIKEYTDIYGASKTSQQGYRGRRKNPLPYKQEVEGGRILYSIEEVEKWRENGYK